MNPESIDGKLLLETLPKVLERIRGGAIFRVLHGADSFILGPAEVCGAVFQLIDPYEYGWPVPVDAKTVSSIDDLAPSYRRHPSILVEGRPLTFSISESEFELLTQGP